MGREADAGAFYFESGAVGYFLDRPLPSLPGRFRYMPYRSVAHYKLIGAVKSVGPQRCHYVANSNNRWFKVVVWISYGVLELSDFEPLEVHGQEG